MAAAAAAAAAEAEAVAAAGNHTTPSGPPLLAALAAAAAGGRAPLSGIVDAFEAYPAHAAVKLRFKVLMEPTDRRLVDDVATTSIALLAGPGLRDALSATWLDARGLSWSVEEVGGLYAPPPPPRPPDAPPQPEAWIPTSIR